MKASNGTKVYGAAAPAITPTYTGLVNGDVAPATAPTCSTTATPASPVATYPSSCSGAADPSYTFTYTNGSVTVTKAPLTVTAESRTLNYGFTPSTPVIARLYTGLVNGERRSDPDAADVLDHREGLRQHEQQRGRLPVDLHGWQQPPTTPSPSSPAR